MSPQYVRSVLSASQSLPLLILIEPWGIFMLILQRRKLRLKEDKNGRSHSKLVPGLGLPTGSLAPEPMLLAQSKEDKEDKNKPKLCVVKWGQTTLIKYVENK